MNRILTTFFAILLLCLTACNKKPENNMKPEQQDEQIGDMVSYVDKKYKVKVNYPRGFVLSDTSNAGMAFFCYPDKQEPKIIMRLVVEDNKIGWNEKAAVKSAAPCCMV